jgi:hypothetical protein
VPDPVDLLENAFADLKEAVLPYARLAGVDAAHATVRRRRRARIGLAVAAAVLVPVVVLAVLRFPPSSAPVSTPATQRSAPPAPAGPRLQPLGTSLPSAMFEGVVPVPTFGDPSCPEGSTRFHNGGWTGTPFSGFAPSAWFDQEAVGDVTGDGQPDLVVVIRCLPRPNMARPLSQVAAYDGATLIGQVVGGGADLSSAQVQPDGTVRVLESGSTSRAWATYRWSAGSFRQVGGLAAVPPTPRTSLSIAVTPTQAPGTLTQLAVTVHNGGTPSDHLVVTFTSDASILVDAPGWATVPAPVGCHAPSGCPWSLRLQPVPTGVSASGTFTVLFLAAVNGAGPVTVTVTGWLDDLGEQSNVDSANTVTVPLH